MTIAAEKLVRLMQRLKESKAGAYPIENHPLAGYEDVYVSDLYLRMLCVIVQFSDHTQEEQQLLLERLMKGIDSNIVMSEYMRSALDADDAFVEEFISQLRNQSLKYPFVLDSLVLAHASEATAPNALEFIAELSDLLRLTSEQVRYIAALAESILEQDEAKYRTADDLRPEGFDFRLFFHFTRSYAQIEDLFICFDTRTAFHFEEWFGSGDNKKTYLFNHRKIHLENLIINTGDYPLLFQNSEWVHLRNCEFIGSTESLMFQSCAEVKIEHCLFGNFSGRTIIVEDVEKLTITSSKFYKCKYKYSRASDDWQILGGVFFSSYPNKVHNFVIDACEFNECGGRNMVTYFSTAVISNCVKIVKNSKLVNCWNNYNGESIDPDHPKRTLFSPSTVNAGNQIINSANFQ